MRKLKLQQLILTFLICALINQEIKNRALSNEVKKTATITTISFTLGAIISSCCLFFFYISPLKRSLKYYDAKEKKEEEFIKKALPIYNAKNGKGNNFFGSDNDLKEEEINIETIGNLLGFFTSYKVDSDEFTIQKPYLSLDTSINQKV